MAGMLQGLCGLEVVALRGESPEQSREGWKPPALKPSGKVSCGNGELAPWPLMSHAPQPLPGLIVLHRHLCKTGPTLGLDGFPPPSGQCPAILTLQVFTAFLESRVLSRGGFSPRGHQAMSGAISCGPDWCGRAGEHILGGQAAPTTVTQPTTLRRRSTAVEPLATLALYLRGWITAGGGGWGLLACCPQRAACTPLG